MAITTLDGIISGAKYPRRFLKALGGTMVAARPISYWGVGGNPGPGSWDSTLNGVSLTAPIAGQIPFDNPVSGNTYLARLQAQATIAGQLLLCDRLWHNGGITITSTSPQAIASPAWPSRDANGLTAGTGVFIGVEVSAGAGAGTPTLTLDYTNSDGVAGRTGTNVIPTAASPNANTFYEIGVQAGDVGVRSVQNFTLSASWSSGTINLVAYRVLAAMELQLAQTSNAIDAITGGFPRLFDGTVPFFLFVPSTTTTTGISGTLNFAQG